MKLKIKIIIPTITLILALILSIALWNTKVFDGTYTAKYTNGNDDKVYLTFSDNTFYLRNGELKIFVHGFYQYIPDGEILNWEDGYEYLTLGGVYASHSTGGKFVFRRNNIFSVSCMMDDLFGLDDKTGTYYCWSAIWLQVFYVIVFLGSIIFLILGLKKSKKKDE